MEAALIVFPTRAEAEAFGAKLSPQDQGIVNSPNIEPHVTPDEWPPANVSLDDFLDLYAIR